MIDNGTDGTDAHANWVGPERVRANPLVGSSPGHSDPVQRATGKRDQREQLRADATGMHGDLIHNVELQPKQLREHDELIVWQS